MNFPPDESKPAPSHETIMIGWTTTETRDQAEQLARGLVETGLVACAQIDGPINSIYRWESRIENATEFRLTVKFPTARESEVEAWIHSHHAYETPQWICVTADSVSKNYLNWVMRTST